MKLEIGNWFRSVPAEKAAPKPELQESTSLATLPTRDASGLNDRLFSSNFKSQRNTKDAPNAESVIDDQCESPKRTPSVSQKTRAALRS